MNPNNTTEEALRIMAAQAPQAVNQPSVALVLPAAAGVLLTLYMMAILLRWFGTWLELDEGAWWMRLIAQITDPLITAIRRLLPPMGPVDWGPMGALIVVWLVRIVLAQY
ncbi:MAG: YggT family protein [Candidatus Hydrogenedentota bacterium]